jgi:hypothetical protein
METLKSGVSFIPTEVIVDKINLGFTQKRLKNCKCVIYLNILNFECMNLVEYAKNPVHRYKEKLRFAFFFS